VRSSVTAQPDNEEKSKEERDVLKSFLILRRSGIFGSEGRQFNSSK
jgi:hypothetical protein